MVCSTLTVKSSVTRYLIPFTPYYPPPNPAPFPLLATILPSVWMSFCLSLCRACSFVALSFIFHIWVELYGSWFFLSDLFQLSMIVSGCTHVVANGGISSSLMAESCSIVYMCNIFFTQSSVQSSLWLKRSPSAPLCPLPASVKIVTAYSSVSQTFFIIAL